MKKYLAFALALIMALALIPGIALADKGGPGGGGGKGLCIYPPLSMSFFISAMLVSWSGVS